ncbi:single-stranded-DNA-specific exonuclease RecJ [Roseivirga sp. UBA1976]|uniref:single-stranded-DNA-specific exonuclease RecJ n=1 Tax=Roseivirga sp. UBA1976 TaxID=1947386 RepID=UPI00257C3A9D|nr:single-stranded-DNA-specific exonuclease RecJ [Roseivirga sp. UBA1976]MEC7755222.1 single-stranded-DNA-specific exonuclease RecJ [Bacteroidota bacterium]|tara:strand:- start:5749 stop:7452 length:1704 start_codon:yes stop_codon:yes gene_type:complete
MQKRWIIQEDFDGEAVHTLQQELGVSETLAKLIQLKGINTFEEARDYFRPSLEQLHDPFLMKDMDRAVNRLTEAIGNEEGILIYGDYDVDGTTAVATFYGFLSRFYNKLEYYIPDRYKEGYGVSEAGIRYAAQNNYSLIVTLDCGIKAYEKIQLAKELGIDVIVCDHHTPGDELPPAYAVLDPKRNDCPYPYKELSGCGVGFKLLQGFSLQSGIDMKELWAYLDLLAVSIASDIVPITGENRILAHFGLKKLNQSPRPGLKSLIDLCKTNKDLTISGIVFGIGPRINAAGRMDHAGSAVALLLANNEEEANLLAEMVNNKNDARRDFDSTITEEAIQMISTNEEFANAKATVLFKEDWHKGVIGIVASRCIEKFYRPTVILTESNEKVTGSARSVDGFDIYAAISECSDLLDQYGGHMYAAGVTMSIENVEAFRKKFEAVVAKHITPEQLIPSIHIDSIIKLNEIDRKFFNIISQMAPFGPQNMQPVFVVEHVQATNVKLLKEQHLKFTVKQPGTNVAFDAIGFGLGDYYDLVNCGLKFHMAFTVEENEFRGLKSLQLFVKDIKFDD